jgi:hypothetical protein
MPQLAYNLFKFYGVNTMKSLIFIFSLLMLGAQSAYAAYGVEDGTDNTSQKSESVNAEVEVREFLLLDSVSDMELGYSSGARKDVEGAGGSVYTGSGTVTWDTNIATTVTLSDATLTNIDGSLTTRNTVSAVITFAENGLDTMTVTPDGETAYSKTFNLVATLAAEADGDTGTQRAGTYRGQATVVAAPAVSS